MQEQKTEEYAVKDRLALASMIIGSSDTEFREIFDSLPIGDKRFHDLVADGHSAAQLASKLREQLADAMELKRNSSMTEQE